MPKVRLQSAGAWMSFWGRRRTLRGWGAFGGISCHAGRARMPVGVSARLSTKTPESVATILLVDAEAEVKTDPREHLLRQDGWDLRAAPEEAVHLMVQVMETWIVADPDELARYYGQGFKTAKLSGRIDLEQEPKTQVQSGLKEATRRTGKGRYNKISHASELLARIRPARVQARCQHCKRLFEELDRIIAAA